MLTAVAVLMAQAVFVPADHDPARIPDMRMAAWHRTMATTHETTPNTTVKTYLTQSTSAVLSNVLIKFAPAINGQGATQAKDIVVEDFPGGVTARFTLDGVRVTTEIVPLFIGRGTLDYEGAALYRVSTDPPTPLKLGLGGTGEQSFAVTPDIEQDTLVPVMLRKVEGNTAQFLAGREELHAGLWASADLSKETVEGGEALSATFGDGAGEALLVYGHTPARVEELLSLDREAEREKVGAYYASLLSQYVDTPEDDIDNAWRSALYNLEYNWNEPYGWNECIHHWLAMWHNQHTAGAEWIGQEDRSRLCTVTHAENLLPSGAVPHYTMDGGQRRDFGGSNHFWTWQARHYWHFTGDKEFAATVAPALDKVLAQTFEEHDRDNNLLVGWGLQIGNQEDFVEFYNDGATPSIEVINMMRTRAELAGALDDEETAALWRSRAAAARDRLIRKLWLPDLGRLGYYVDQHGVMRPDAQYHTFLYASLWDIVDELDGYTSLRQVHDLLTGARGEVYCSNNFPNHANGTWGMQAGAAQQPWAAWAFSKAGQRNHAYRPLLSIASQVMNKNLRGAWPEVMYEHTPAYFTPPAGLYVASVIESIFGLYVDAPGGALHVSPGFPDHWPKASMQVAKFGAEYVREGNTLRYTVHSEEALARKLRWAIAPAGNIVLRIDGVETAHTVEPGVDAIFVEAESGPATSTTYELSFTPIDYTAAHNASAAEGAPFEVELQGAEIVSLEDRSGLLDSCHFSMHKAGGRIAEGQVAPYLRFGRLGQVTFSRRTLFLECLSGETRFWTPVDVTVLPRIEASAKDEVAIREDGASVAVLVRNNLSSEISGTAVLHAIRNSFPFRVSLEPRSEAVYEVAIPANLAALFSVGDNNATISLPSGDDVSLTLTVAEAFRQGPLADYMAARVTPLPLPPEDLSPYEQWANLREGSHGGPVPWPGWVQPMTGIETQEVFESEDLPGVRFEVTPGQWVLVGERIGQPYYRYTLEDGLYKKFFLLVAGFWDNHDMFTRLGQVTVRGPHGVVRAKPLHTPGDLDWWERQGMMTTMDTARFGRPDRLGLLPLLSPAMAFWTEGPPPDLPPHEGQLMGAYGTVEPAWIPPSFPQPEYWASCRVIRTPNCNFNVIEIDLGKPMEATSLSVHTEGLCPGLAIYGLAAEKAGGMTHLEGSPWKLPGEYREPTVIFNISGPEDLEGWTLEGFAYGPAVGVPSLNSLVTGGEAGVGAALSPAFHLPALAAELHISLHGGTNKPKDGEDNLVLRLLDAETEEVLARIEPAGSHALSTMVLDVHPYAGREVRIALLDANTESSYAWIGLRKVSLMTED